MMENRCWDVAPLEVAYTPDPAFLACVVEANLIASSALQRVYEDALKECMLGATRSTGGTCCFARAPDSTEFLVKRQIECDDECGRRAARKDRDTYAPRGKSCQPEIVSPPRRSDSRAHTAAVVEIISRCQRGSDESAACTALSTHVERTYCTGYCDAERTKFNGSLALCTYLAKEGARIACNLDEPVTRQECEARCREQSSRGEAR